jgi:hypothetical protein
MARAALGLRPHSGWAALVIVAGAPPEPAVIDRRRIEIADSEISGSRQPYHEAEGMELPDAERLLKRCADGARRLARIALRTAIGDARKRGYEVAACGLLLASGRPLPGLDKILTSHALIHAADGEHFREALTSASEECRLAVTRVPEREIWERAGSEFRTSADALRRSINELGKSLGPPWTQDQKLATLVGCLALAAGR